MVNKRLSAITALALSIGCSLYSAADAARSDKSVYTLFNRTPDSQLRELTTDRPDLTESPYTVDAGWVQVEMDVFAYGRDHDKLDGANVRASALSFANINLKFGLTSKIDLQTVLEPFTRVRVDDRISGTRGKVSGFGDITSRLKINFWGNDGGSTAFGIMPFVKWPTNQHGLGNKSVEGGLIIPLAVNLPGGWDMGTMTEFDVVRNESDSGYSMDWVNSITFGHDIAGKLGGYAEIATTLTRGRDLASFDLGFTYGVNAQLQFDAGANFGLTRAADDLLVFSGVSFRF